MTKKGISKRKRLAAIFASFAVLIMGTASLIESMSFDYYSVLGTLEKIIPASIALGALGWVMGMVLDKPRRASGSRQNRLFLNKIVKSELHGENILDESKEEKESSDNSGE